MIARTEYLQKLIENSRNGMVKIITGIRRCGKSVLLFQLFAHYLTAQGVDERHIIKIKLDERADMRFRNPITLCDHIRDRVAGKGELFYIFIDEVQLIESVPVEGINSKVGLYEALNELNGYENTDVYVTGSNSKMLSSDIATEFRGRGSVIRVHPFSFREFYDAYTGDKRNAFDEYTVYGGMPFLMHLRSEQDKIDYLKNLFDKVYLSDIIERNNIKKDIMVMEALVDITASSVGSLTSPTKLANTFRSKTNEKISANTVFRYLDCLTDSFLIGKAKRYDIKGKDYIDSPLKFYFEDIGLRNVRLRFQDHEITHIMENIIYNELIIRGFNVDVGVLEHYDKEDNKTKRRNLEIDFVCNKGNNRYYIQSAYALPDRQKQEQETRGFLLIDDSFQKIVIMRNTYPWRDERGILYIGIEDFLLNKDIVN